MPRPIAATAMDRRRLPDSQRLLRVSHRFPGRHPHAAGQSVRTQLHQSPAHRTRRSVLCAAAVVASRDAHRVFEVERPSTSRKRVRGLGVIQAAQIDALEQGHPPAETLERGALLDREAPCRAGELLKAAHGSRQPRHRLLQRAQLVHHLGSRLPDGIPPRAASAVSSGIHEQHPRATKPAAGRVPAKVDADRQRAATWRSADHPGDLSAVPSRSPFPSA
eukprot:CAMPEP_0180154468 /NCGR_PEP_ID=MMETSP0986-20121125/24193_1 /TAXON_ID=697907 /ORGANISM="non described non described, Strain CCMP2293" /LENGTH=219 /DNA_ID=CAMNT_0022102861 /DNA_START=86 /DNA_END=742 /DNA_ORIENTATION=+